MSELAARLKQALYIARKEGAGAELGTPSLLETSQSQAETSRVNAAEWHEYRARRKDDPAKGAFVIFVIFVIFVMFVSSAPGLSSLFPGVREKRGWCLHAGIHTADL